MLEQTEVELMGLFLGVGYLPGSGAVRQVVASHSDDDEGGQQQ